MRTPYTKAIRGAAGQHGLDPDFLEAQVLVESSGLTDAFRFEPRIWEQLQDGHLTPTFDLATAIPRRVASSYGLLQILYITARDLGFQEEPEFLFIPDVGLEWGAKQLRRLLDWSDGDLPSALAAYNGGKRGNSVAPLRNQAYVDKVFLAQVTLA